MRFSLQLLALLTGLGIALLLPAQSDAPQENTPEAVPEAPAGPEADAGSSTASGRSMTLTRLDELLNQLDQDLTREGPSWQLQFRDRLLLVVADGDADRMRIMSPVADSAGLDQEEMYRLLQANFDSALDARYAVAQGTLWSVFIHPLSPLTERQLASAIFQVYNTAATFGTVYSSGEFTYGGGDSNDELRELEEELERLLRPRT